MCQLDSLTLSKPGCQDKVDWCESPLFQNKNKALTCIKGHNENWLSLYRRKYCLIRTISDIRNSDSHWMGVHSIKLNPLCEQHVFSGLTIYEVNANLSMQLSFSIFNKQKENVMKQRGEKAVSLLQLHRKQWQHYSPGCKIVLTSFFMDLKNTR